MEMTEKVALCKQCKNRSFDPAQGIVCKLTKEKPNFDTSCRNFLHDEDISERQPLQMRMSNKEGRGGCLTTLLVLIIIGASLNILSSAVVVVTKPNDLLSILPIQYYLISLLTGILSLAGAILMFQWKKMGIYIYGIALLINLGTQIQMPHFQTIQLAGVLIGLLVLFAVIAPKWSNFK